MQMKGYDWDQDVVIWRWHIVPLSVNESVVPFLTATGSFREARGHDDNLKYGWHSDSGRDTALALTNQFGHHNKNND